MFGGISSAMIGLVFAYKWLADGRRDYDLYWAWGHFAFGAAVFLAAGVLHVRRHLVRHGGGRAALGLCRS